MGDDNHIDISLLKYMDEKFNRIEDKLDKAIAEKEIIHYKLLNNVSYLRGQLKIVVIVFGSILTALSSAFIAHFFGVL